MLEWPDVFDKLCSQLSFRLMQLGDVIHDET